MSCQNTRHTSSTGTSKSSASKSSKALCLGSSFFVLSNMVRWNTQEKKHMPSTSRKTTHWTEKRRRRTDRAKKDFDEPETTKKLKWLPRKQNNEKWAKTSLISLCLMFCLDEGEVTEHTIASIGWRVRVNATNSKNEQDLTGEWRVLRAETQYLR